MTQIDVMATGPELLKRGMRGIEPVVEEIMMQAQSEIQMAAYMITPSASPLLNLIEQAAQRGIKISIVINDFSSQDETIKGRLEALSKIFPHVRIFNFVNPENKQLHAKVIVVDRKKAVVGSANFSWGGMYSNYEVGLLVEGEPAWKLGKIIDILSLLSQ